MIFQLALIVSCVSIVFGQQCSCGVENTDSRIIGGTTVTENKYPWMAVLSVHKSDGRTSRCGGSIINEQYVLTAAHCLEKAVAIRVGIGANSVSRVEYVWASGFISHPRYDPLTTHNDIGLIKLSKRLTFSKKVRPVCLPTPGMAQQGPFTVAGWGKTEAGSISNILLETSVDEYPWDSCNREWNNRLTSTQFCAALIGKDSCGGDSGGPLTQRSRGRNYVVGLVSYGVADCGSARSAVYTKVASFLDWIKDNTRDATYCSS